LKYGKVGYVGIEKLKNPHTNPSIPWHSLSPKRGDSPCPPERG